MGFLNPRLVLVAFSQFGKYQSNTDQNPEIHHFVPYLGIAKSSLWNLKMPCQIHFGVQIH